MDEKTVRLFHKADWLGINFSIRQHMTGTELNIWTITKNEIDEYVEKLTKTITSVIEEKVPIKSIKSNSIHLLIEIRDNFGNRVEFRSTNLMLIVYRSTLARISIEERQLDKVLH